MSGFLDIHEKSPPHLAFCHKTVTFFIMTRLLLLLALTLASPAAADSPIADAICWPTETMREKLKTHRGNSVQATGLRSPEEIVEIWTGPEGDWTMVIRYSSGTSCIVAMGEHWEAGGT